MVQWAQLDWERMLSEGGRWWLLMLMPLLPLDRKALAVAVLQLAERQVATPLFEIDDDCY